MASTTVLQHPRVDVPSPAYQSILASHYAESDAEDTRAESATTEENVHSVVGVSISREQTRLKSPTLSATEKAAALNDPWADAFFDAGPSGEPSHASATHSQQSPHETHTEKDNEQGKSNGYESRASIALPTPWTSGPRVFETYPTHTQQDQAQKSRPRSGTVPMGSLIDLNLKRFVSSFTMPSFPRPSNIGEIPMPALFDLLAPKGDSQAPLGGRGHKRSTSERSQSLQHSAEDLDSPVSERLVPNLDYVRDLRDHGKGLRRPRPSQLDGSLPNQGGGHHSPKPSLKRTTSDQSFTLRRVTSMASSLGDDSRWEHVQKQVNSRAKAISDSLQDSKFKLPDLPSLPAVNLRSLRPDFLRSRAVSDTTRPSWPLESGHGAPVSKNSASSERQDKLPHPLARPEGADVDSFKSRDSVQSQFDRALESLTGDIVILGGYRGSVLRSAKPPHRQLWVPIKVGLNIRKVNLEVGLEPEDEEIMQDTIIPSGMLSHIGPIDMGRRLLKRLRSCRNAQQGKLRVHDYGYDWRLSPHLLSQRLIRYLEQLPVNADGVKDGDKGATVIAHSLGGLITRHAVNQRPELFAGVIYAGVPQHCVNILGPLRKGDEVLLSSKVLTAQVNFTLRTSFLLLPEDGRCFIDKRTKEEYPVNFFDPAEWKRYALSPCIAPASPPFTAPERKGLLSFVTDNLPSFALVERMPPFDATSTTNGNAATKPSPVDIDPHLNHPSSSSLSSTTTTPQSSTIPLHKAEAYLTRTLASILRFKAELKPIPHCAEQNLYPPLSVLYSNTTPTVSGARVASRAAIKCSDAYDDLAFASGDGVCLARAAMLPKGYAYAPRGKVKTERGHVGLLGDLEAVGRCLLSVIEGREKGVGLGLGLA
ncbi:MAG: hypothetical protein LQ345_003097 [Seirophora villosa]|nr:MAG: hypothetical protein LQ345_003097 [Seirophora villosa]